MQRLIEDTYSDLGFNDFSQNYPDYYFPNEDEEREWKLNQEIIKNNG